MSLLRKIRRRHKAFVLKRLVQITGNDTASSVSSVDDCEVDRDEDEDEDEDVDFVTESLQQADVQNVHVAAASPWHETHQMPSIEHNSVRKDVSAQSLICVPTGVTIEDGDGMDFTGKETRFWPRIVKTSVFLLVTAGAFSVGKLAAVGITLTLALACKLFAKGRIDKCESLISAGTGQVCRSHESLPSSLELVKLDSEAELSYERKVPFVFPLSNDMNGHGHMDMEAIGHDQSVETLSIKANGDSLLAQRKQLKRINCMKLPSSASPLIEAVDDSPSSSVKVSPRMWFGNVGSSMAIGEGTVANSAEMNKQRKFKSKVFLRHLRKGEPQSAPSSPSTCSQEASHGFCVVSDGSDTERPTYPADSVRRKSKFRPASPVAKEASRADANMISALHKEEKKLSRETMPPDIYISPFQKGEEKPSASMPATTREAAAKTDVHSPLASTHELPHKRRGRYQCTLKPVTSASQDAVTAENSFASVNEHSLRASVQGGEKKHWQVGVGTPWIASGLVIIIGGLFMGRMVAIAGLVCYWYALSLKSRKASERRR